MCISVIHMSDIHIKDKDDLILSRVDELKRACVSSLPSNGIVVIVISGDIAQSGTKSQYELASGLLKSLSDYIVEQKGAQVKILCVPGNHDCDLTQDSSVRKKLIDSCRPDIIDGNYYNTVISGIQSQYREFAESLGIDQSKFLPRVEISCGENNILFLLANTSWMSVLDEKPGKTIIPCHLFENVSPDNYSIVFYVFHHPINWLDPDYKKQFITHVRQNADIILMGHEHERDSYEKTGNSFSVYCSHGKELQDRNSISSAFTVINFDRAIQNYTVIDFVWNDNMYKRVTETISNQYHKNIAAKKTVFTPNEGILQKANDIGIAINHFAKENVTLTDLFVWPDLGKSLYWNEHKGSFIIRKNTIEELEGNTINIFIGSFCSGKTTIAKALFLHEESTDNCCLLFKGSDFSSGDSSRIQDAIDNSYAHQYSKDRLEEFRQLPREKRFAIVDDFDLIKDVKGRRNAVLDYLNGFFGRITIILSSSIELASIISSQTISNLDDVVYYDILPFGNKKRFELISKWYRLDEYSLLEDEIVSRIDSAEVSINTLLGNGNAFIPAYPIFLISALQNIDAKKQTLSGSKYSYLYESLIQSNLSAISSNYASSGNYEIDIGILSKLAFNMLLDKTIRFSREQLDTSIRCIAEDHLLEISPRDFLQRMINARILYLDSGYGEVYRFMYPYMFYFFCGRYIAYHLGDSVVQNMIEYMSNRLYNETYGNIIVFVCHFANNSDIIDDVLLNAYNTLDTYKEFDFTNANPVFADIKDAVNSLVPKRIASSDADVSTNKQNRLSKMDEMGFIDGHVTKEESTINDELSESEKEKDMASVVAALKTIEVLGEILQNYPTGIQGQRKLEMIDEIHKLSMRSIQAIIDTIKDLEQDLVDYVYEKATRTKKSVNKGEIIRATHHLINMLVSGMARGMIHQVALSLNSKHLLPAAKNSFENDNAISSKLILLDLKLNCLHLCNYDEIRKLKKDLDSRKEMLSSRIVDSIVGYYLNYNTCDHDLRAKLCSLCGLSQQLSLIAAQRNLLN